MDIKINKPKFLIRWRFDFLDKPTKFGMWMSAGPSQHGAHMAWSTNKEELVRASIEGKDIISRKVKTLAACDGHDFVNLKWYATVQHGLSYVGKLKTRLVGMILQTRELDILYLIDGNYATKVRTDIDKNFHYAGFGR